MTEIDQPTPHSGYLAAIVAACVRGFSGCEGNATTNRTSTEQTTHDHEGHEHDHHLGPRGGHLAALTPGKIAAEWVIFDEGRELQIFLPESTESVKGVAIHARRGEEELELYSFEPAADLGQGAWRLASPPLFNHIKDDGGPRRGRQRRNCGGNRRRTGRGENRPPPALMSQPGCRGNHVSNPFIL